MSGYSGRRGEDMFDDDNEDILDPELDEYPDFDNLPDFEDLDQENFQKTRTNRKSGRRDDYRDEKKPDKKRRRRKEKIERHDPDWDD